MSIISQTTWEKFTKEEKKEIRELYSRLIESIIEEPIGSSRHIALQAMQDRYISLFGKENLQPKSLTYEDVARELFFEKESYCIDTYGRIVGQKLGFLDGVKNANNCTSEKQAEKLLAINRLITVAKFLNKNEDGTPWKPGEDERKLWTIGIEKYTKTIMPVEVGAYDFRTEIVYFRTEQRAQQAIQILGEDTVRLALTTEY